MKNLKPLVHYFVFLKPPTPDGRRFEVIGEFSEMKTQNSRKIQEFIDM